MQVDLGVRRLKAVIKAREEAKQDYEQAKTAEKIAALLEQQRENVFQMHVANIMPDEEMSVELH